MYVVLIVPALSSESEQRAIYSRLCCGLLRVVSIPDLNDRVAPFKKPLGLPPVTVTATAVESTGDPRHGPCETRPLKASENLERDGTVNGTAVTAVSTGSETLTETFVKLEIPKFINIVPNTIRASQLAWRSEQNRGGVDEIRTPTSRPEVPAAWFNSANVALGSEKPISPPKPIIVLPGWRTRATAVTAVFRRPVVAVIRAVVEARKSSTERARHPWHGCRGPVATVTGGSPKNHHESLKWYHALFGASDLGGPQI
ncbi:hypothetical protein B0H12DRAFT_1069774 [Mycena haematopus]|nr:hypothetical protein B0H12DRAFT_1069774 [Mycena haematopus]